MAVDFISILNQERELLVVRISAIDAAIKSYGSEVLNSVIAYPYKGTWEDKITFILEITKTPLTAKEISEHMKRHDINIDYRKLHKCVTLVSCQMAKRGKIYATKGHKNIYELCSHR